MAALGTCRWCGHVLVYASPGDPPSDCMTDYSEFYGPVNVWRDFSLVDYPLDYGKFCPYAQGQAGQAIGQFGVHELGG